MQPARPIARVLVRGQEALVYDAASNEPLFRVDLSRRGAPRRILDGCAQRRYDVPQVHANRRGTLQLNPEP